jgi:hypothetical protein
MSKENIEKVVEKTVEKTKEVAKLGKTYYK